MTFALPNDFKVVEDIVEKSSSSFSLGMQALPADRRGYLFAIYAYCRILDDIADDIEDRDEKIELLDQWREKIDQMVIGKPSCEVTRILYDAVTDHHVPSDELYVLIEGMKADALGPIVTPSWDDLYTYCRQVAGSVGLLALPLFGRKDEGAKEFAIELGYALQLTNILRDVSEDYDIGRVYLPKEPWEQNQVTDLNSPEIKNVLQAVADRAQEHYVNAEKKLREIGSYDLKPAILMMVVYRKLFEKMKKRGWHILTPRMRLSTMEKMMTMTRVLSY